MTSKSPGFPETLDADDEAFCSACGRSYSIDYDHCPNDGAALTKFRARPDLLIGRVFHDRYEVRSTLGHGGMGTVYRGWQVSVDREVAIKVIHARLASDRTAVKRFLREARLSSRLSQASIVNVFDHGQTEDGILYIVMEMLRGHSLSQELASGQPMPPARVITMALQLCDALDAAHGESIIHRDLKPGNIVVLDEPAGRDFIKVLDFGLAKTLGSDSAQVTNTDAILGTPLYMAPEQIVSGPTDQRTDLYALGCLLHHMLTGRPPFTADTVSAVFALHVHHSPPPLPAGTPAALAGTVMKLMQKDPAKRFSSAAEVRAMLEGRESRSALGRAADRPKGPAAGRADPNEPRGEGAGEHASTVASDELRQRAQVGANVEHARTVESDGRHEPVRGDIVGQAGAVDSGEVRKPRRDRRRADATQRNRARTIAIVMTALLVVTAGGYAVTRLAVAPHGSDASSAAGPDASPPAGDSLGDEPSRDAASMVPADVASAAKSNAPSDARTDMPTDAAIRRRRDASAATRPIIDAGARSPADASDDPGFITPP